MSSITPPILTPMVRKLRHWSLLDELDREALLTLPYKVRVLTANQYIVREGENGANSCVLLSGYAIRHKIAGNGGRQIMSLHMTGDLVDLQNSMLCVADHNVQAISAATAAYIPVEAIAAIALSRPAVGEALWRETLVEASIFREALLNIGRRDARTRVAHFLCEISLRLEAAGLFPADRFELPVTQEQLGDLLGLTSVHVNRTLQALGEDGIIDRAQRSVVIRDLRRLRSVGDFASKYLHLNGAARESSGVAAAYGQGFAAP